MNKVIVLFLVFAFSVQASAECVNGKLVRSAVGEYVLQCENEPVASLVARLKDKFVNTVSEYAQSAMGSVSPYVTKQNVVVALGGITILLGAVGLYKYRGPAVAQQGRMPSVPGIVTPLFTPSQSQSPSRN